MPALAGCAFRAGPNAGPTLPYPPTFTYPSTQEASDSRRSLNVDGLIRTYLLHVPPGLRVRAPMPLVLVFHGHRMDADYLAALSGFNAIADANQFLAAYPNGTGPTEALSFNAGLCCGSAMTDNVNEAEFVRRIIADLGAAVDPARIYVTGFSNGALLAYRLACEMSDTIAAIAPVAGNQSFGPCRPAGKVSILHIQGASDISSPYENADLEPDMDPDILSVKGSVAFWASVDGCAGFPYEEREGIATHAVYSSCADGTAVELYTLKGIGHAWPQDPIFPASQTIWEFFSAHPKGQ
jgi:polyhydroxybutyrate depolymerase